MSSQYLKLPVQGNLGADTSLSNLTLTSINQDLVPDSFNPMTLTGRNLGSTTYPWLNGYFGFVNAAVYNNIPGLSLIISASTNDVVINAANINASASTGYLRVPVRTGDPSGLQNGAIWYDTSTNKLRAYINGAAVDL